MLAWKEAYATGVERIDNQHKRLFAFINDLNRAIAGHRTRESIGQFISYVGDYASLHFAFEEDCMAKSVCPMATKNKKAHEQFIATVAVLKGRYDRGGSEEDLLADIRAFVEDWLVNHICKIDVGLRDSGVGP